MAGAKQGLRRKIRRLARWRIWRGFSVVLDFGPQLVLFSMLPLLPALGLLVWAVADIGVALDGQAAALATGAALSLLSALTLSAIAFGMLARVRRMTVCVENLDAGKESATIYGEYLNVFGALARAIDPIFHKSLQVARLRSGLDVAASMVMISNANGNIVYVNDALRDLFESFPDRIREQFPAVDPFNLVGTPMRTFYSGATDDVLVRASRGQMDDHLHVEGVAHVGSRKLRVRISSIVQPNGRILGSVAQWDDRTDEFQIETEIEHVVDMMSMGELDIEISVSNEESAFFKVSHGVNDLLRYVKQALDDLNALISAMASGDLTQTIDAEYHGKFGELKENSNKMMSRLTDIVGRIEQGATGMNASIATIHSSMEQLSQRSDATSQSLTSTTAATVDLANSIKSAAENARKADQIARAATASAVAGHEVVQRSVETMADIEASSRRVSDIVGVIDDIAFQTNLLALNAAVEAARAGDAGRGFAVVASEVRSLAQRASASAADIRTLVQQSGRDVRSGVAQTEATGQALRDIESGVTEVAALIGSIAQMSDAQETGVVRMTSALADMDDATRQNSHMAQDTTQAVRELAILSEGLSETIAFFSGAGISLGTEFGADALPSSPLPDLAQTEDASAWEPPDWTPSELDAEFNMEFDHIQSTG